jgi:hypothetical protein
MNGHAPPPVSSAWDDDQPVPNSYRGLLQYIGQIMFAALIGALIGIAIKNGVH